MPEREAVYAADRTGTNGRVACPAGPFARSAEELNPRWFALRLRVRFEFQVRDALRAAGIEEFCPTWVEQTRWTDRTKEIERPLFPGYVFARFDGGRANAVMATRGVVQILGAGSPEPIDDEVIAGLQRIAANPALLSPCAYVAGESVTVCSGPLAGVTGVIQRIKGAARLIVRCEILQRAVSVEIDAADVELID